MTNTKRFFISLPALLLALPAFADCARHGAKCKDHRHPQIKTSATYQPTTTTYEVTETAGLPIGLPTDASVGDCFARMAVPAKWETVTEQVVTREASERLEIVPAEYETITEQVLVRPESHQIIDVPPVFERVTEQVLVEPARSEWQYVDCGPVRVEKTRSSCAPRARTNTTITKYSNNYSGNKRLCLVEIPARYETITRNEMVQPPSTRTVSSPAEYRTITRQVVKTPARQVAIAIPAEYGTVTRQVLVADAGSEWQRVDCVSGNLRASNDDQVVPAAVQASSYQR